MLITCDKVVIRSCWLYKYGCLFLYMPIIKLFSIFMRLPNVGHLHRIYSSNYGTYWYLGAFTGQVDIRLVDTRCQEFVIYGKELSPLQVMPCWHPYDFRICVQSFIKCDGFLSRLVFCIIAFSIVIVVLYWILESPRLMV